MKKITKEWCENMVEKEPDGECGAGYSLIDNAFVDVYMDKVLDAKPKGIQTDRMPQSPSGPFDVIISDDLVLYRRPERDEKDRIEFRRGSIDDLRKLAAAI